MDLIRAGLQDLDKARALFDQLKADDIPDERCAELLSVLARACDPDMALSNFVDIVNAMQSSQRDLEHVIPDNDAGTGLGGREFWPAGTKPIVGH